MNTPLRHSLQVLAACCLAAAGFTASAAGTVNVSFVNPEQFSDADRGIQRDRNLEQLAKHLRALGQRELADGETLDIRVTDVDLAGRVDPFALRSGASELRILKGAADWPRIQLSYTLQRNGVEVRSADERLADLNYLNASQWPAYANRPLSHEKHMLDEWFEARFAPRQVGSR